MRGKEEMFAFAQWVIEWGWEMDYSEGCLFRECEDQLTPDVSMTYRMEDVYQLFKKHPELPKND